MFDWMKEFFDKIGQGVVNLLPLSPFAPYIAALHDLPFLGYINWFLPVGAFATIATLWGTAIGLYYAYSVIARWVKLIS